MAEEFESLLDYIAEQNRLIRTGGLPKDHPLGKLEPCDYPLSPEEARFFKEEAKKDQELMTKLYWEENL